VSCVPLCFKLLSFFFKDEDVKRILLLLGFVCSCSMAFCQAPKDVPEVAQWEIQRRGNHVEMTGTYRSGLMAAALSPPADDSAKWFVTLVYRPGDAASEKMRNMIATDKDIRAWIDGSNAASSFTHYHERVWDLNGTQADWLAGLVKPVNQFGLPVIVLQPPRSGAFGKPETIVKLLHGVSTGKELSAKLRNAVVAYIQNLEDPSAKLAGIRDDKSVIGAPPPFNVPPPVQPPQVTPPAAVPFDWPPVSPQMTIEQVESICPGADPKFVLGVVQEKLTSPELVRLRWKVWQIENPKLPLAEEKTPHPNPLPGGRSEGTAECEPSHPSEPLAIPPLLPVAYLLTGCVVGWILARVKTKLAEGLAVIRDGYLAIQTAGKSTRSDQAATVAQPIPLSALVPRQPVIGTPNGQPNVPLNGTPG